MTLDRDEPRLRLAFFLLVLSAWFGANMVFRWLGYPMFRHQNEWAPHTALGVLYQSYAACLPIALWASVAYLCGKRVRLAACLGISLPLAVLFAMFIEADMGWYQMSRTHLAWSDVCFLLNDAGENLGLRRADVVKMASLAAMHITACCTICGTSCYFPVRWLSRIPCVRAPVLSAVIFGLVMIDSSAAAIMARGEGADVVISRAHELTHRNPLRLKTLDVIAADLSNKFSERHADLEAANQVLCSQSPSPQNVKGRDTMGERSCESHRDVVLIIAESLNDRVFQATNLPFFQAFSKRCLRLRNHFSTGNSTMHGVLGLLFGSPVTFFKGPPPEPGPGSPYLAAFASHGYTTKLIGPNLLGMAKMGNYLSNFTDQPDIVTDDWLSVKILGRHLATAPEPQFVVVFYNGTHFPYRHALKYRSYVPEVREDFDYSRWDARQHAAEIIHRYQNSLCEFDAWLEQLVAEIDLSRSIVIITGDHGEEMFEDGRIAHCSCINTAQTQTPCLVYLPDTEGRTNTAVTSHADLLPTVADALGWDMTNEPPGGRSLLLEKDGRVAFVAQYDYLKITRWATVTDGCKSILDCGQSDGLRIVDLLDSNGDRVFFRDAPDRWENNFIAIRRLEASLRN